MAEFNSTCPACGIAEGIPQAVTAARGVFMVELACRKCGHKWRTERTPDVQLFQPRPNDQPHTP